MITNLFFHPNVAWSFSTHIELRWRMAMLGSFSHDKVHQLRICGSQVYCWSTPSHYCRLFEVFDVDSESQICSNNKFRALMDFITISFSASTYMKATKPLTKFWYPTLCKARSFIQTDKSWKKNKRFLSWWEAKLIWDSEWYCPPTCIRIMYNLSSQISTNLHLRVTLPLLATSFLVDWVKKDSTPSGIWWYIATFGQCNYSKSLSSVTTKPLISQAGRIRRKY